MYSLVVAVDAPVVAAKSPNINPKGRTKRRHAWRCRDPAFDATIRPKRLAPGAPLTLDGAPTVCIGEQRILCKVDATVLLKGP